MNSLIIDKENMSVQIKGAKLYTSNHTIPLKLIDILIVAQSIQIDAKTIINLANENIPILYGRDQQEDYSTQEKSHEKRNLILKNKALHVNLKTTSYVMTSVMKKDWQDFRRWLKKKHIEFKIVFFYYLHQHQASLITSLLKSLKL